MRRRWLFGIGLAAALLVMLPGGVTHATPSMPYILVNESTKQCYVSIMNDECFWCDPPAGWKVFGTGNPSYGTTDCPAGYRKIDQLELVCKRYKTPLCCGGFSSHVHCCSLEHGAPLSDIHES